MSELEGSLRAWSETLHPLLTRILHEGGMGTLTAKVTPSGSGQVPRLLVHLGQLFALGFPVIILKTFFLKSERQELTWLFLLNFRSGLALLSLTVPSAYLVLLLTKDLGTQ